MSAQDRPADVRGLHELYLALANTGKHVQTVTVVDPDSAAVAVGMARAVCGGDDERMRAEPPISALLGTVTPLGNDAGTLEAGLGLRRRRHPDRLRDDADGRLDDADHDGRLAGRRRRRGAGRGRRRPGGRPRRPVFICFIPSVMDLKTGDFTGGAPEDTVMGAAVADIGRFYGLPTQCGVNSSGAKAPSWQSALDDATTTLLSLAAGVDMLTGVGMVSGGRIFSYAEMALGAETVARARRLAAGLDLGALGGRRAGPSPARSRTGRLRGRRRRRRTARRPRARPRAGAGDPLRASPAGARAGRRRRAAPSRRRRVEPRDPGGPVAPLGDRRAYGINGPRRETGEKGRRTCAREGSTPPPGMRLAAGDVGVFAASPPDRLRLPRRRLR